jgi:hypothetical protein
MRTLAIVLLLQACGGDDMPPPITPEDGPAAIALAIDPVRSFYHSGQLVTLTATVTDVDGAALAGEALTFSAAPEASVDPMPAETQSARFTLTGSGAIAFTACVVSTPELCDTVEVTVDDGSPVLEVETPLPGAEIDDPAGIVVRGSVADASGALRVFVNGAQATLDEMGIFETTIAPRFGVEHLEVVASDALTPVSTVEMDVLWAPAFTPATDADGRPSFTLDDSAGLWLGQRFFDDGVALDPAATPLETRDLADLLELVALEADLSSIIPDPVVDSAPAFVLRLTNPTIASPEAEVSIQDGGLEIFLRVGELRAVTAGTLVVDREAFDLAGTIDASLIASASLTVEKESPDSEVVVELGELVVSIESVDGAFENEEVTALFRLASGLLRSTLEAELLEAMRGLLGESVPTLLREVLGGLDRALAGQSITIDSPPLPAVEVTLDGRMSRIETNYRRELLAPLQMSVSAPVAALHSSSRGFSRLDPSGVTPDFFRGGEVELGLSVGFLNAMLHVLWNAGLLDLDLAPLLPEGISGFVSDARLEARLPPMVRPSRVDESHDLVLTLGQVELVAMLSTGPARFGVQIGAGIDIDLRDNRLSLVIADEPVLRVWAIEIPADESIVTPEVVTALIADLWPDLKASLGESLSLELPIPPLDGLAGIAPDLATFQLTLGETDPRLHPRGELVILDAAITGRTP